MAKSFQSFIQTAEDFLVAEWYRTPVPVLRTPRGRIVAIHDFTDGKIGWNLDMYDVAAAEPINPTLAAMLLLMDNRQCAVGAYTYKQKRLIERLEYLLLYQGTEKTFKTA